MERREEVLCVNDVIATYAGVQHISCRFIPDR